ncbi:fat-2 [Symbiodinium microadriaticum]|nr:fat-2 [Symbiodinium microadriaticum]
MWFGAVTVIYTLIQSEHWKYMSFWAQASISFIYFNFTGFFMWALFVVAHDCGHGTFSDYEWLNDLIGNLTHGAIMVPYWPWRLTHHRHHMYHNHEEKDYSHKWYTPEVMNREDEYLARFFHANPWLMSIFPYIGWPIYLMGLPDGCHFFPFPSEDSPKSEHVRCIVSSLVVIMYAVGFYTLCGNLTNFMYYYVAPVIVFGWWLVTVTYLQHHSPSTKVYGDDTWKYVDAAFETVDRHFGFGIDYWSHHITDGHVVHHLFFTKIPHYNLSAATKALTTYLEENGLGDLYRYEDTTDFFFRVHKYMVTNGLRAQKYESPKKTQ